MRKKIDWFEYSKSQIQIRFFIRPRSDHGLHCLSLCLSIISLKLKLCAIVTGVVNLRRLFQTNSPKISILRNIYLMISRFGFRYAVNRTEFGERTQVKKQGCAPCPRNIVQHCVSPAPSPIFFLHYKNQISVFEQTINQKPKDKILTKKT